MHLFHLIQKPLYQGLLFIVLTIVVTFIAKPRDVDQLWVIFGLTYCLFILTNLILALIRKPPVLTMTRLCQLTVQKLPIFAPCAAHTFAL